MPQSYMERDIARKVEDKRLTVESASLVQKYFFELDGVGSASEKTLRDWYRALIIWCDYLDFSTATYYDILRANSALGKKGLKQNTLHVYISQLKRFYTWMASEGYPVDTAKLQGIRTPPIDKVTKKAGQMLSPADIKKLISTTWRSRDRALFSMMYEGGFRPVELLRLKWGAVKFDDWGAVVNVVGIKKTRFSRFIRLIESVDNLAKWKNDYPLPVTGDARVFVILRSPYKDISYEALSEIMSRIERKASLDKPVTPYLLRHSRITHLVEEGVHESVIKMMMWGTLNTEMLSTYAHVTGEYVDRAILDHYGIREKRAKPRDTVSPRVCGRCRHVSGSTADFCARCGLGLTDDAVATVAMLKADIWNHPEVLMELAKELQEKKEMGD